MSERQVRRNETLRDAWFEAANEILATEGYGALKLAPLCRKLGVTTGSFYHSFDNWQDFTDSLLDAWLTERTERLAEIARQNPDPVQRLQLLISNVVDFNHRAEAAIRVWAGVDERVAVIQRKVDRGRHQAASEALAELVGPERAPAFATWGLGTVVGFEMLSEDHPAEELQWALEQVLAQVQATAKQHRRKTAEK
ncbi:TetR family transcriptional regulator [Nocardioides sp. J9]|uniref:TetR/AcrR family transcriptional regulator n=1 Tax=Nocardioides sp. J9 TaxID=935844 RepID=UPI0011A1C595|nr:TetR/AcrR family transcriptional regulator [Nocardioides sp. J9]TWG89681.1 TetR family transcriptional regulator [Nocardioides sp. J9]